MVIEQRLYDVLKLRVADRAWPSVAKQGTAKPFIVYTNVSSVPDTTICGTTEDAERTFQVDIYHENAFDLIALRRQVFADLKAAPFVEMIEGWQALYEEDTRLHRCLLTVQCYENAADI